MSTTALEIETPQLRATQLAARPGTLPTITFPMRSGAPPDVMGIWEYLREVAEFFALPMPGLDELVAVLAARSVANPTVLSVTIAEQEGAPQILVSAAAVTPTRPEAVRISGDPGVPTPRSTDPWWRRMAARTTSRGAVDHLERWLNDRGHADAVTGDVPILGALVFSRPGGENVGVENPEPTSVLDQMERCGAISVVGRSHGRPADAVRAWWISPRYETHPVAEIDGVRFPVDPGVDPSFTRWS